MTLWMEESSWKRQQPMGPYINDVSTRGLDGVMEVAWIVYCRSVPIPNLKDRDGPKSQVICGYHLWTVPLCNGWKAHLLSCWLGGLI